MDIIFGEKYWGLYLLLSLIIATGVTLLLYFRNRNELTRRQHIFLTALRFLSIFLITFLLTGPLIKTLRRIVQNPVVVLAVDNSSSLVSFDDNTELKTGQQALIARIAEALGEKFDLVQYTFGETVKRNNAPEFNEKRSGYSALLQAVYNNHFNDNIGALLVVGDGIYNAGENPLNVSRQLQYPIYTLALGDTTLHRDVRVAAVRNNRNAFTGNLFPVEIDVQYHGVANQNIKVSVLHSGTTVFSETLFARESDGFHTFMLNLNAEGVGLQYYTVFVETAGEEKNKVNNSQQFVINILENKQRILILSNGVHPDAGALKNALESQVNYDVTLLTREPYPADFKEYDLLVLCQIPSSAESGKTLVDQAAQNRIPVLYVLGSQTHIQQFNLLGTGAQIELQAGNMEDTQPALNKSFAVFTLSEKLIENMDRFPPLKVPFGRYNLDAFWNVVAFQRIRNIETDRPVMAVANRNGIKSGIIFGEGIWRWRMYNYLSTDSHAEFNELMDKLVQYLALRDNSDNFIIDFKPVYQETEPIIMTAEVYNDVFEPITTPEVNLVLQDSTGQEFTYQFDRGSRFYRLDAGLFSPGDYHFTANVEIGGETYTETGNFAVMPVNIELVDTRANHRLLYQLAQQSGGGFYLPDNVENLTNSITSDTKIKPFSYFQTLLTEILHLKWIFFLILMVLSLEWFLRKYWGIY